MIVQLQCHCHWPLQKQNRIKMLIAERAELILGNSVSSLVSELNFVDSFQPSSQASTDLFGPYQRHILLDKRSDSTYRLVLSSEILFPMMQPGSGQACFDELVVLAKKAICESQLYKYT